MKLPNWATTVTPLSETLALVLVVLAPVGGFAFGVYCQRIISQYEIDLIRSSAEYEIVPVKNLKKVPAVKVQQDQMLEVEKVETEDLE